MMGQRSMLRARMGNKVVMDFISLTLILIGFTIFLYLGVFVDIDPNIALKGLIGGCMIIGGIVMIMLIPELGFTFDRSFSQREDETFMFTIFISLVAIFVVNLYTPSLSITPIQGSLFYVLIGIAEEVLFRGLLLTWTIAKTGNPLIAIGVSSYIGAAYHSAVYGVSNQLMMIVFLCFCVLGFAYLMSGRRLSTVMAAHAIVNLMSFAGTGG